MVAYLAGGILALIAIIFILKPLFRGMEETDSEAPISPAQKLTHEKEGVYLAIREVEFDHRTGVVSDEDYKALVARYRARAIELMKAIDKLEGGIPGQVPADSVESEIRTTLAQDSRTAAPLPRCPACGAESLPVHRFCTKCGRTLPETSGKSAGKPSGSGAS